MLGYAGQDQAYFGRLKSEKYIIEVKDGNSFKRAS